MSSATPVTPASTEDTTSARLRALLVRAPTAAAFVSGQRFEVVSEEFNHLFGFGDDTDRRWPAPDRLRVIIVPDGPVSSSKEGA